MFGSLHRICWSNFTSLDKFPEKAVLGLAQVIVPRHVHVNEAIYVEDTLADSVSFIYSGRVVVHCKHHGDEEHKSLPHANKIERMYGRELHRLGAGDMCGESSLLSRISRASNADSSRHQHITSDQIPTTGEYFESYIAHRDIVTLLTIVTSDFLAFYILIKHICWHPNRCIDILKMAPSLRKRDDLNVLLSFVSQVGFFKQLSRPNQLSLCSVMNLRSIEKGICYLSKAMTVHHFLSYCPATCQFMSTATTKIQAVQVMYKVKVWKMKAIQVTKLIKRARMAIIERSLREKKNI